jgi:hypothetical protein
MQILDAGYQKLQALWWCSSNPPRFSVQAVCRRASRSRFLDASRRADFLGLVDWSAIFSEGQKGGAEIQELNGGISCSEPSHCSLGR